MLDKALCERAQTAFIRARIQLLSSNPFYAHLVMKLPLRWMEDCPGGLSATDGREMIINPEAFLALSKPEQVTVLVHEVLHCAAGHLFRIGSRDKLRFNVAGDVYIANVTEADGFTPIALQETLFPQWGIVRSKYKDMTTEQIYDALPPLPQQPSGGSGGKKGTQGSSGSQKGPCGHWQGPGGCFKEPAGGSAERSSQEAEWRQNVIEAGQLAGSNPGAWSELVKAAMPRPPFHLKLFEYLSRGLGGDTTFDTFDRRALHQGWYLPSSQKVVMGEIAVAVDTSGSMSSEQLALAFGYIRAFREQHPCKLHLIQCDYDAIAEGQYKLYDDYEPLPAEFKAIGRGGTSFDAPFKLMREKRVDPKVMIYLTDGYGTCSIKPPSYPTLWVVLRGDKGFKPPFGDVVQVGAGD